MSVDFLPTYEFTSGSNFGGADRRFDTIRAKPPIYSKPAQKIDNRNSTGFVFYHSIERQLSRDVNVSKFLLLEPCVANIQESEGENENQVALTQAKNDRLRLLVDKYVAKDKSIENEARIQILTARLRRDQPKVLPQSWMALAALESRITKTSLELDGFENDLESI